jgi:hypothetical protein
VTHSLIIKKEIADIGGLWDIRELSPVKLVMVLWHLWLIQSDQNRRDSLVAFVVGFNYVILPRLWDYSIVFFLFFIVFGDRGEYNSPSSSAL